MRLRLIKRSLYRDMVIIFFLLSNILPLMHIGVLAGSKDVTLLNMLYVVDPYMNRSVQAYRHGLNASIWSRNFSIAGGRKVNFVSINPSDNEILTKIKEVVDNNPNLLMIVGPADTNVALKALPACEKHHLVMFAPLSEFYRARFWTPHLYFFFVDTLLSTHALLRYVTTFLRVRRIGFMYATGVNIGQSEFELGSSLMDRLGQKFIDVFVTDGSFAYTEKDKVFQDKWESFAATKPQAVIILGDTTTTTESFVRQMSKDPRTRFAYMLAPSFLQELVLHAWTQAVSKGAQPFSGQVITTSSYPLPKDTHYALIQRYREVMVDYLVNSGQTAYSDPEEYLHGTVADMMIAGWVAGEVLVKAVSQFNSLLSRKDFIDTLFNQRIYLVHDVAIGQFGATVDLRTSDNGIVANCNQGGTTIFMKKFEGLEGTTIPEGKYEIPATTCYVSDLVIYNPIGLLILNLTDIGELGMYVVGEILRGQKGAVSFFKNTVIHELTVRVLVTSLDRSESALREEKDSFHTDVVTGLILDSMVGYTNVTFIDPLFLYTALNLFDEHVIFLSPTVEQQLFTIAEYVAHIDDKRVHAVIRNFFSDSSKVAPMLNVLRRSFLTWRQELTSVSTVLGRVSLRDRLPTSGLIIVLEVEETDVESFAVHLEKNKDARIFILTAPFAALYPSLLKFFRGKDYSDRLLFTTNLPHWNNTNYTEVPEIVKNYHHEFNDISTWSPLSFLNYLACVTVQFAAQGIDLVDARSVAEYFFSTVVVEVNGVTFGPFANSRSVTCTSLVDKDDLGCAKNFGATSISLWTMARVFDTSEKVLYGPVTPSMIYRDPKLGLNTLQLIGIILGSLLVSTTVIIFVAVVICYRDTRNTYAPKNLEHPVTLIFTDIQSSTALWAACPEIMPDAVETHHRLIRQLIAKYKCYEVKTIGDSFMIACNSPYAAVQLVGDLQRTFLEYDWGTSAMDEAYHDFEEAQAEEDADYKPPTARLDDAVYREHWRGLRVRAGVHTGLSDIRHDAVTKRYDYYGSTSNTAARTESVANGGQVLLTRATYFALSTVERAELNVTALGAVELRGVPEPVEMFQLNPVPGRAFAKLRLDREFINNEYTSTSGSSITFPTESQTSMSPNARVLAVILTELFSPFPPLQRVKAIEPLCNRWGVTYPEKVKRANAADVCHDLTELLSLKLDRVVARRQGMLRQGRSGNTSSSSVTDIFRQIEGFGASRTQLSINRSIGSTSLISIQRPTFDGFF